MSASDWTAIVIIFAALVAAGVILRPMRQRRANASAAAWAEEMADIHRRWDEIHRMNADTSRMREQLRELERHPVGSIEGFRVALRQSWEDPRTIADNCSSPKPHEPHLWRYVRNAAAPDVDESMRRCDGTGQTA